jgi:phosphohistidine swiveling domain-containing protein
LLAAPLPREVEAALQEAFDELSEASTAGLIVRASLSGALAAVWRIDGGPQSVRGVQSVQALREAVHELWARSMTSAAVEAYAEAGLKDTAVGVLIQPMSEVRHRGFIARRDRLAPWQLGTALRQPPGVRWPERLALMVPLADGRLAQDAPAPLRELHAELCEASVERLLAIGEAVVDKLGDSVMVTFALRTAAEGAARIVVLAVHDQVPWSAASEGRVRVEIAVGGSSARPPTPLSQSVLSELATSCLADAMEASGCRIDSDVFSSLDGRCFVDLEAVVAAAVAAPMWRPESTSVAIGGAAADVLAAVSGRVAGGQARRLGLPLIGVRWAYEQLGLDRQLEAEQQRLASQLRQLSEVEFALLPSDALGTSLRRAQSLLRRAVTTWLRVLGVQQSTVGAVTLWLRRRVEDVDVGHGLISGAGGGLAFELARSVAEAAQAVREDPALQAQLASGEVRSARDLPDVRGRGVYGSLLSQFGDMACSAFELARPRWREDGREFAVMLSAVASLDEPFDVVARHHEARAVADRQLADLEPSFGGLERRVLRMLIDRGRHWTRHRAGVDRNVYRALYAMRRVVLDVDRRIARFDEGGAPHALYPRAFLCPLDRLVRALDSGHPDLGRVLRMREADRSSRRQRPILPPAFCGSPVRWGTAMRRGADLDGIGLSSGVVEGVVRIVHDTPPTELSRADVLVMRSADVALAPCYAQVAAVVVERGGFIWPSAELARELALPMVAGIPQVRLRLRDGDRVRVDGDSGTVSQLEIAASEKAS